MSNSNSGGVLNVGLMNFLQTAQLDSYISALQLAGGNALPLLFADSTINSTLFVPTNDAFAHASETTRGYSFQMTNPSFLQALLSYHAALGTWTLQQASPFHVIIPTTLDGEGYSDLDDGKPQVISCLTAAGENGALKTTFPNEKSSPSIVNTLSFEGYTIQIIDQALGIPGQYTFEYNNSGVFQFEDLRVAAGAGDFENWDGFTAFAPAGDPYFFQEAQVRFPSREKLGALFNNHVIYGKTVWSSDFTKETYTSESGFNYTFTTTPDGNITVSLNGITTNITTADVLVSNGVIHLIDDALWNLTPNSGPGSSSSTSLTASSTTGTSSQSGPTSGAISKGPSVSSNVIVAIVVSAVVVLLLLAVATFYMWRYYRALGIRELTRRNEALDSPLTPNALRTSPFDSRVDLEQPLGTMDMQQYRSSSSIPTSPTSNIASIDKRGYRPDSVNTDPSYARASSASPTQSQNISMTEEVMERLLQTLAQRIDRGADTSQGQRPTIAPPVYQDDYAL